MTQILACRSCGSPLDETDRFCASCGSSRTAETALSQWAVVIEQLRAATRGEFDVAAELGHGGMAAVFLAHDIALDKKVAIKVMAPSLMSDQAMVQRFLQEARTVARLEHPNIVPVYAARQTAGLHFFVMKYVEGQELESLLHRLGALPLAMTQAILHDVASALQYAHEQDVIHRDIKPSNIMIDRAGKVVVADFGIAKLRGAQGLTVHGAAIGTPQYMSPEQCRSLPISAHSDQYSLGILAYHMLTGAPPFRGEPLAVMRAHVEETPPPIEHLVDGPCPRHVGEALTRMLAKEPGDRWPNVLQAVRGLGARALPAEDPVRTEVGTMVATPAGLPALRQFATPHSPLPQMAVQSGPRAATPRPTPAAPISVPTATPAPPSRRRWPLVGAALAGVAAISAVFIVSRGPSAPPTEPPPSGDRPALAAAESASRVLDVRLSQTRGRVAVGRTLKLRAQALDRAGRLISNPAIAWRSMSESIATVSGDGVVLGLTPGVAIVVAMIDDAEEIAEIEVLAGTARAPATPARPAVAVVHIKPPNITLVIGQKRTVSAEARDEQGRRLRRPIGWRSENDSIARVSRGGVVRGIAAGQTLIGAMSDSVFAWATVTVTAPLVPRTRGAQPSPVVAIHDLAAGRWHTCAGAAGGRLWCWGDNQSSQIRQPRAPGVDATLRVPVALESSVESITAGDLHTCGLRAGAILCWGRNDDGQLGSPDREARSVTTKDWSFNAVTAGSSHTCGITVSGDIRCWGKNEHGQIGDRTTLTRRTPVRIGADGRFSAAAAGGGHTCALRNDGQLLCWGSNWLGQSGIEALRALHEPTPVAGSLRFSSIAAGQDHTCALTTEGRAYCWGQNREGQVGDGTLKLRAAPTAVKSNESFSSIVAGGAHSCALTRAGKALCWGQGVDGQLGDGASHQTAVPVAVQTTETFVRLAAGDHHTCGSTKSGAVLCWGANDRGQIGGTAQRRLTPTAIAPLRN